MKAAAAAEIKYQEKPPQGREVVSKKGRKTYRWGTAAAAAESLLGSDNGGSRLVESPPARRITCSLSLSLLSFVLFHWFISAGQKGEE